MMIRRQKRWASIKPALLSTATILGYVHVRAALTECWFIVRPPFYSYTLNWTSWGLLDEWADTALQTHAGFEIRALAFWCRARYLSVTEAPHNIESLQVSEEETFCFFETWRPEWGLNGYLENPLDPLDPRPSIHDPRPSTLIFFLLVYLLNSGNNIRSMLAHRLRRH